MCSAAAMASLATTVIANDSTNVVWCDGSVVWIVGDFNDNICVLQCIFSKKLIGISVIFAKNNHFIWLFWYISDIFLNNKLVFACGNCLI